VYDVTNESSFQCMDRLKKQIEKNREKKEVNYCLRLIVIHANDSRWEYGFQLRLWVLFVCFST